MQRYPGTSLTEQTLTQGEALQTYWRVKSEYQWDMGVAMGRFLSGLREGKDTWDSVSGLQPYPGTS